MKGLVLIVPAARSDQHFHAIVDAVEGMITLDPAYKDGKYDQNPTEGIKRAGMIYFPWLFSDEYLQTLKTPEQYQTALMAFGTGWSKTWDANALVIRYEASRNHDASAPSWRRHEGGAGPGAGEDSAADQPGPTRQFRRICPASCSRASRMPSMSRSQRSAATWGRRAAERIGGGSIHNG